MSTPLQQGANAPLPGTEPVYVGLSWEPRSLPGMEIDGSAFLLQESGRVRSDADFIFYNQPRSAEGSVMVLDNPAQAGRGDAQVFLLNPAQMPASIQKIAFAVTIHEGQARGQSFGSLQRAVIRVAKAADKQELMRFELPLSASKETAMIFGEVYLRNGQWKFRAVGQGFAGGLGPLATSFGVDVGDPAPPSSPPQSAPPPSPAPAPAAPAPAPQPAAADDRKVKLQKRMVDLEKKDPKLVSLVKKVNVSLEKANLATDQAKVALCLDISGSMYDMFMSGKIDALVQRVMAMGFRFDDDGDIDVFLFGKDAHNYGTVGVDDYKTFVPDMRKKHPLEGGTYYGKAIKLIRDHYRSESTWGRIPVYVMFVTDGNTLDEPVTATQMREASKEAIFWQFMAIGKKPAKQPGSGLLSRVFGASAISGSEFAFLEKLDDLDGREVDNANFFLVEDPLEPTEEELYESLMVEYPGWLRLVLEKGILKQ